MKQPIAGVAPPELEEVTVMDTWPSICAYLSGRFLGWLYSWQWPGVYIFRIGNLLALLSIPHALLLYAYRLSPSIGGIPLHGSWYRLTNRRVVELRNELHFRAHIFFLKFYYAQEVKSVPLDRFNSIEIEQQQGQHWFHAGDLVFKLDGVETFRLLGVSRPEPFRATCMHSQRSFVGVKKARERELVNA